MSLIIHTSIFLSICFLAYWLLLPQKFRSLFLFLASLYFMSLFSIGYTFYFVLNAVLVYVVGIFINKKGVNRSLIIKLTLFWLIGSLCVFKYTHIVFNSVFKVASHFSIMPDTTFAKIALPLGISYVAFRFIHYIVEIYRKTLPEHKFWDFALYVFFFPTFIAGPVDRFGSFQKQTAARKPFDPADLNYGLFRIMLGLVKKFIIADTVAKVVMPLLNSPQETSGILLVLGIYGLAIQLYMDFSGYTDMAIGVARLFGYRIMENFNNPLLKDNIADLWRNWHISVYSFIRDYFFFPLFGSRASIRKLYFGIFLSMVVFHLWHEGSFAFLFIGIYHGLGLVIWQLFQGFKRTHYRIRKLVDSQAFKPVSIFLTFSFFSFSITFFHYDVHAIQNILRGIFL